MLLKKSIASLKNPSCDNGTGGNVLLCAPSLQWDGLCGRDNRTSARPELEPAARPSGSRCQPSVYSVLCGGLVDGVEAMEREQHRRSARSQNVWHSMRSLPSPCACSNSP